MAFDALSTTEAHGCMWSAEPGPEYPLQNNNNKKKKQQPTNKK